MRIPIIQFIAQIYYLARRNIIRTLNRRIIYPIINSAIRRRITESVVYGIEYISEFYHDNKTVIYHIMIYCSALWILYIYYTNIDISLLEY